MPTPRPPWSRTLVAATLLVTAGCAAEAPTSAPSPTPVAEPQPVSWVTDVKALEHSVHADLQCVDCHPGATTGEAQTHVVAKQTRCTPCHDSAAREVAASSHAGSPEGKHSPAAACAKCHGAHDIAAVADVLSPEHPGGFGATCARCHRNPQVGAQFGIDPRRAVDHYFEANHTRALLEGGLVGAPDCLDCHGKGHAILGSGNPASTTHPSRVAATCGRCHAGALEEYQRSVHAQPRHTTNQPLPTCSDCHPSHAMPESMGDATCGGCHADRLRQYLQSHHGQASALGDKRVASCSDCHGAHAILPTDDPASSLSTANRQATCARCHAGATPGFTQYAAHVDPQDRDNYPFYYWIAWGMNALLLGALVMFAVHTALWMVRGLLVVAADPGGFVAKRRRFAREQGRLFERFSAVDRFSHGLLIASFLLLVATGMPLKFHEAAWAQALADAFGGVRVAAGLHRLGAALLLLSVVSHLARVVQTLRQATKSEAPDRSSTRLGRLYQAIFAPDSLAPRWQDVRDLWAHLKWFVGRGPRPAFDRFSYWEKLDYFAVFWSLMIIGATGLVMVVPVWTAYVLPGWAVNVAQTIHGDEALLVAGFIFAMHFFNIHFRVDRFPLDLVMFSGRIPEEQMREERARQYARLVASGRLDEGVVRDDWHQWKPIVSTLGLFAVAVGTVLVLTMAWGVVGWIQQIAR